jgi:hypothetical protein
MNKVTLIVSKLLLSAILLENIVAIAILLTLKFSFGSEFNAISALTASGSSVFAVMILLYLELFAWITCANVASALCVLSRKKWLVIAGGGISLLAGGYAGYLAILVSQTGSGILLSAFCALSGCALFLAYLSRRQLTSNSPLGDNTPTHALLKPALIFLSAILPIAGYWLIDEPIDPNFHRFYTDNHRMVPVNENVAVGLAGLDAPVETNFMEVGFAAFKNTQVEQVIKNKGVAPTPEMKNKIAFVGSREELDCWIGIQDGGVTSSKCASEKRLNEILRANTVLLSRYWQVSRMPHFQGFPPKEDFVTDISRLIAADVELKLRHGRFEEAFQEWRANYQFANRMIGEEAGWVEKATFAVADSYNQASAEALIHNYKGIAKAHGDELVVMFKLQPSGLARWNIAGTLRAEYAILQPFVDIYASKFWFHPNYIRNSWLHSSQAFIAAAQVPQNLADKTAQRVILESGGFRIWNNDYLRDPMNTVIVRGFLLDPLGYKSIDLLKTMHIRDAKQRALTLALLIKRRGIKDSEISNFLASVDPELKNPFTGNPMIWDAKKHAIVFTVSKTSKWGDDANIDVRL